MFRTFVIIDLREAFVSVENNLLFWLKMELNADGPLMKFSGLSDDDVRSRE